MVFRDDEMVPLGDVQRWVLSMVRRTPVVPVPLEECLGLVLAAPVTAGHDLPPFANSAVDGYAVRIADVAGAGTNGPAELAVVEEIAAGAVPTRTLDPGTAIKVMTGAPLPEGAEGVVRVEDTSATGDRVEVRVPIAPGTAIRPAGGDVARGDTVLQPGGRLGPADLGVLASLGVASPRVRRRPTVAIMSTGDELDPVDTGTMAPGRIRDSNRPLLRGMLDELGADVIDLGIVADDPHDLDRALLAGVEGSDAIISSGGVSMGDHDVVKERLAAQGTVAFGTVAMQPGKPLGFGTLAGGDGEPVPFFGLPGNPVSVAVSFEQFVRPALLHMMGAEAVFRPRVPAVFEDGGDTNPAKEVFLRVTARQDADGGWRARSAGGQSSNVLSAMAAANAFAVVPRGTGRVEPGAEVVLEMFRQPSTRRIEEGTDDR